MSHSRRFHSLHVRLAHTAERLEGCIVKSLYCDENHAVVGSSQPCRQRINHHPTLLRGSNRVDFKDKDLPELAENLEQLGVLAREAMLEQFLYRLFPLCLNLLVWGWRWADAREG